MPTFIEGLAQQTAGNVIGAGMGLALGGIERKNQIKQQGRLNELEKGMTKFNMEQQLKMWKDTNYSAQVEQMKKAGINPALLYGMGGAGGATTNIEAGQGGGKAQQDSGAMGMMTGMGQQTALIAAQTENIKADTEVKKAGIPNIGKEGNRIDATTGNIKADTELKDIQAKIGAIEETIKGQTQNAVISRLKNQAEESWNRLQILKNNKSISDATVQERIDMVKAELIGIGVNNALGTQKTAESKATISKMAADIIQKAQSLDQEQQKIEINKWVETVKANFPSLMNVLGRGLNDLIENIIEAGGGSRETKYEPPKKQ